MTTRMSHKFSSSVDTSGVCKFILMNNVPNDHSHIHGYIEYCITCWWKEIMNEDDTLVYRSIMNCQCTSNLKKQIQIQLCKETTTVIYVCNHCSLRAKSTVKHWYIYPQNGVKDYDIFFACPYKNITKTFQTTYNNLSCFCCNEESRTDVPLGYQWLCHSCESRLP